jgi:hypothetical protein
MPRRTDVSAFQRALWKSRRGRPRPAPQDQARGQVPPRQPRLERIEEDPVERQLRPAPPGPVPQQRQPALHQRSDSSSIGAVNAALGTVTGTTPGDGDCALHAAADIGRAQLGPEELAAANAAAGALRTALLQHARERSAGCRQQAGTLGWGPTEWARHAAAATYTATGEPGAAGAPALGLVHSSEYLPPELMPSLAACIGADIAVLTRDMTTGDIKQRPHACLARPAEGTGAVVQVPLHWRLLAGRLGQQSRPHARPGAGRFLSLDSGSSCLTDATTRPVGGTGDTTIHCHTSGTAVPLGQAGW